MFSVWFIECYLPWTTNVLETVVDVSDTFRLCAIAGKPQPLQQASGYG